MQERPQDRMLRALRAGTTLMEAGPDEVRSRLDRVREALYASPMPHSRWDQLLVQETGGAYWVPLRKSTVLIGAAPDNDIILNAEVVSGHHCCLKRTDEGWLIRDEASRNGTYVNGARIDERYLMDGDIIQVADTPLIYFRAPDAPPVVGGP